MGNNSRSLIVSGAVCVAILIISLGMYVFESSNNSIDDIAYLSEQEKTMINSQFNIYEGVQSGSNLKKLVSTMITNSNIYEDEELNRLPCLIVSDYTDIVNRGAVDAIKPVSRVEIDEYVKTLTKIRNSINSTKSYVVEFEYSSVGIIDKINILEQH